MKSEINGVSLHWEKYGEASELPPVLLLHGWGCSITHFKEISRELSQDRVVYVIDFPAHGESSRPPQPWGVPEFTQLVSAFIKEQSIAPCDIIAHSFGGRVSLWLSSHEPQLVNRMVLTGCAGIKKEQTEEQKKRSESYKKKKELLKKLEHIPFLASIARKKQQELIEKYGSADYKALDEEMRKTFVKVISQDLRSCLKNIKASTLLVFGENDQDTPLWQGQIMEKEIPDAGLVVFEGDDHFAYLRQWPRFTQVVKAFLQ